MKVFRNYYGASVDRGIGVQAQSAEIAQLNLDGILKELSSLHALESSEHDKEMLSYLVEKGGYSILGVSYTEQPKSSGYNRSAPCGLQYVVRTDELAEASTELGSLVNFVSFQKPDSASPVPLDCIPRNESGYTFHNSPSVIAPLIDGLVRVALSPEEEIMIIALPKGKNSEYASARYTIAELLCYLPVPLRMNIRFFTGLPVQDGKTNPIEGLDNAVRFGANVIFCPNEYYRTLISRHKCYGVDMDQPDRKAGTFAQYIADAPDISDGLASVLSNLSGSLSYDALNSAAEKARTGGRVSIDGLQKRLAEAEKEWRRCDEQLIKSRADLQKSEYENGQLHRYCEELKLKNNQLNQQNRNLSQQYENISQQCEKLSRAHNSHSIKQQRTSNNSYNEYEVKKEYPAILKILLNTFVAIILIAAAVLLYNGIIRGFGKVFDFSGIVQETATTPTNEENTMPLDLTNTGTQLQESVTLLQESASEPQESDTELPESGNEMKDIQTEPQGISEKPQESDTGMMNSNTGEQGQDPRVDSTSENISAGEYVVPASEDQTGYSTNTSEEKPEGASADEYGVLTSENQTGYLMDTSEEELEGATAAGTTEETIEEQETSIDSVHIDVTESLAEKKAVVSAEKGVNFREGAGKDKERIKQLPHGTELTVIGELVGEDGEKWYKVRYNGTEGYVMAEFVKLK